MKMFSEALDKNIWDASELKYSIAVEGPPDMVHE